MDTASWRSFECRKTTSSGNSSDEVHSKHSLEENTCMTSFRTIEFSIPSKRFRFGLSNVRECHSYLQGRLLIQWLAQELSTIGFLYLSKGLESGCQVIGIVIHPENTKNLVLIFSEFFTDYY